MRVFALTAFASLALGCGTIRNVSNPLMSTTQQQPARKIVYGGVKDDLSLVGGAVKDLKRLHKSNNGLTTNLGSATIHAMDVPVSLIGDTVTLPVTVPAAIDRAVTDYYLPIHNDDPQETKIAED